MHLNWLVRKPGALIFYSETSNGLLHEEKHNSEFTLHYFYIIGTCFIIIYTIKIISD